MGIDVLAIAKANKEKERMAWERAFAMTNKQLHGFIHAVENKKRLFKFAATITPELEKLGVSAYNNATYQETSNPYMAVDGRIKEMMLEHSEGETVTISPPEIIQVNDQWLCQHTVTCKRGTATGIAKIGFGGTGADQTNPIENASTSALGRALGFLGYGVFGTGIASAEEIMSAFGERKGTSNGQDSEREPTPEEKYFAVCTKRGLSKEDALKIRQAGYKNWRELNDEQWNNLAAKISNATDEQLKSVVDKSAATLEEVAQ